MPTTVSSVVTKTQLIPVLPLRDTVYFPGSLNTLHVAREQSLRALRKGVDGQRQVLLLSQRDMAVEEPQPTDLHTIGTLCETLQALPLPDTSYRVTLRSQKRMKAVSFVSKGGILFAKVAEVVETPTQSAKAEAMAREALDLFGTVIRLGRVIPPEAAQSVAHLADLGAFADGVAQHLPLKPQQKQELLEALHVEQRLELLIMMLGREEQILQLGIQIQEKVETELSDSQREYYLREQLRAIQAELDRRENRVGESEEVRQRLKTAHAPAEAIRRAETELLRLERASGGSPDAMVSRTYLETLCNFPWNSVTDDRIDLVEASELLDREHYGLEAIKDRILDQLAVLKLTKKPAGTVLCFVGPPGVGKTSIARSIANALGRKFVRIALGGLRDEAELRGHRRTYVGSMPGRIIQGLIDSHSLNPVILLDEIDKMGMDGRGDSMHALLEILDTEQQSHFTDHYLDLPVDLSQVVFIATANSLHTLPRAVADRLEIISFSGYTDKEKLEIAKSHLLPSAIEQAGLSEFEISIEDAALSKVISSYTFESGARELHRQLQTMLRKVARKVAEDGEGRFSISEAQVVDLLGTPSYDKKRNTSADTPGIVWGLVVSEAGGSIVPLEVVLTPKLGERSRLTLTGNLGAIMKESAQAAYTFLRSYYPDLSGEFDAHLHIPAGAVPKDGPSAGLAIALALASAYFNVSIPSDIAFTGEISLTGRVLPVGGVRDKVLAALRDGLTEVVIPEENSADAEELPIEAKNGLTISRIDSIASALDRFFPRQQC